MRGFADIVTMVSSGLCAENSARRCSFQTSFNFCSSAVKAACCGKTVPPLAGGDDCDFVNSAHSPAASSIRGNTLTGAEISRLRTFGADQKLSVRKTASVHRKSSARPVREDDECVLPRIFDRGFKRLTLAADAVRLWRKYQSQSSLMCSLTSQDSRG